MKTLGSMNVDVITLFVDNLQGAMAFYQEVFGLSCVYQDDVSAVYDFGNMSINLLDITEAHGLIAPEKVASQNSGSRFMFTIRVEDVDAVCNELHTRGIVLLNGPMDRPWGVRTVTFADPAGHIWEIAQQLNGE